jgi:hypothetical protein
MMRGHLIPWVLLAAALCAHGQSHETKGEPALRLVLSEVQSGSMSSEQYCMLVFDDHRFHAEKAVRGNGQDRDRKVYEGILSDADWNALNGTLDSADFRKLDVKPGYVPLVVERVHSFTISVRRETQFQNLEFMDDNSRKPYDAQLKPLLQWWKSTRSRKMPVSEAPADKRCALDSSHGVFSF